MDVIVNGFLFGLLLCVLIGPVFFALIQNSIEKGFWSGFFMAIGIALSDSFYIVVTYLGISQFVENPKFNMWLGGVGGVIMLIFGVIYLFKPVPKKGLKQLHQEDTKWFQQIVKGFLLNGINPFVLLFWLGIISKVTLDFEYNNNQAITFFVVLIATVFLVDVLKSYFATKLSQIVTPRFMKIMNRVVGIALLLFSLRLFNFVLVAYGIELF
ncbi:LysE family translocator [Roseivirga sp.]|jgi:threonine/homoserine/homoserine lactone efflux protein|uniref:LysE family translocator n=1 Tax=Roseivirga sp. TaxID=1964215 RepID=UPI000D7A6417|nr:LysE family translocator [Roseivirga sp.]MBO6494790.1 LysE family translocator [Roseivirga sp.]PWL29298.1 MAG: homoserine transporter [Roseivirga sp. XM-24bin3]